MHLTLEVVSEFYFYFLKFVLFASCGLLQKKKEINVSVVDYIIGFMFDGASLCVDLKCYIQS
jgi:hypothetical protein